MKLTKTQKAYLKSAAISPIGRTVIYGGSVFDVLTEAGLVDHKGCGMVVITDAGRTALREEKADREIKITPDQISAINDVARRMNASPASVLKRAIMTYAAKFGGNKPVARPKADNVVVLREEKGA